MLQLALSFSSQPEFTFVEDEHVERRVGHIMVRLVACTAVFLRPWTLPALLEAIAWVSVAEYTVRQRDSKEFISLYKSMWWRRSLSALAFFAVQLVSVMRAYPPLLALVFLVGLIATSMRIPLWCIIIPSAIGVFLGSPAMEIAMLIGVCIPLWCFGFWDPRWWRTLPMAMLYKMQLTALLYEIACRLELSFTDWL
jgi:hypothetical protein